MLVLSTVIHASLSRPPHNIGEGEINYDCIVLAFTNLVCTLAIVYLTNGSISTSSALFRPASRLV